jgi:hypothetical protein
MANPQEIIVGTCTVQCWGCNKSETHPIVHGDEYDKQMADLAARGWRRRAFWSPNWDKGPWFCSEDCAYNSYNAKRAEEYWEKKEFEKYCNEAVIPPYFWAPLMFVGVLLAAMLLGDCLHHVRLQ